MLSYSSNKHQSFIDTWSNWGENASYFIRNWISNKILHFILYQNLLTLFFYYVLKMVIITWPKGKFINSQNLMVFVRKTILKFDYFFRAGLTKQ